MTQDRQDTIVVAVAGRHDESNVFRFVAEQASRSGARVHLLHVVPHSTARLVTGKESDEEFEGSVLWAATQQVDGFLPAGSVATSELVSGSVADALVERSAKSQALVLLRHASTGHLLESRSTLTSVLKRSGVPVVVVPGSDVGAEVSPSSEQVDQGARAPRVTVAVDDPQQAGSVVRAGLREAALRGAGLKLVHAWFDSNLPDSSTIDAFERDQWTDKMHAVVAEQLARDESNPEPGNLEVTVIHAQADEMLVEESRFTDLLVVGHRHEEGLARHRLGSVIHHVVNHAVCPVLVIPHAPSGGS